MILPIRFDTARARLARPVVLLCVAALLLFASGVAQATIHNGTINGDEAQATTCSMGSTSQIVGTVTYDDVTGLFSWSYTYGDNAPGFDNGALFDGGTESVSHFHGPAPPGAPAGVQVGTTPPLGTPNTGSTTISAGQGADLLNELWYLNVHSSSCGGGELRGQVLFSAPAVPTTTTPVVLGLVLTLVGVAAVMLRRREALG